MASVDGGGSAGTAVARGGRSAVPIMPDTERGPRTRRTGAPRGAAAPVLSPSVDDISSRRLQIAQGGLQYVISNVLGDGSGRWQGFKNIA